MFCRKCGKQIPDDSNVCPMCGNPVNGTYNQPEMFNQPYVQQAVQVKPKKSDKKIIILIIFAILALLAFVFYNPIKEAIIKDKITSVFTMLKEGPSVEKIREFVNEIIADLESSGYAEEACIMQGIFASDSSDETIREIYSILTDHFRFNIGELHKNSGDDYTIEVTISNFNLTSEIWNILKSSISDGSVVKALEKNVPYGEPFDNVYTLNIVKSEGEWTLVDNQEYLRMIANVFCIDY